MIAKMSLVKQIDAEMQEGWRLVLDPSRAGFQYDTLGRIIRNNIVRGNPMKYSRGVTQTDFNGSVFDRRQEHSETTISEHHKRRDDLSRPTHYNDLILVFSHF